VAYRDTVTPFLEAHCYACHGHGGEDGGVALDTVGGATGEKPAPLDAVIAERKTWIAVWKNLRAHTMPPASEERPDANEQRVVSDWIERAVLRLDAQRPDPGRPVLRRLNRDEYRYTVFDLLGIEYDTHEEFPPDDTGYGFDTVGEALATSPLLVEKTQESAEHIAHRAVSAEMASGKPGPLLLDGPLPDDPAERRAAVEQSLRRFASRAFRRPVDDETLAAIVELAALADASTAEEATRALERGVAAVLASPRFLFRFEQAPEAPIDNEFSAPVDPYALATRLSYFLWSSLPDQRLLDLAASGELPAKLDEEVDRMLGDWRSHRFVESFVGQWLAVRDVQTIHIEPWAILGNKDGDPHDRFSWEVRDGMKRETESLFRHVLAEDLPPIELLTARYTFVTPKLAKFYGLEVEFPEGTKDWDVVRVDLPPESHRRGVLTHGSLLVVTSNPTRTSPVKRGLFVLDNLLGTPPPPAPPNVPQLEAAKQSLGEGATARQLMEAHRADPLCASCHQRMDPIGLTLENFNAVGLYRDAEGGKPIDSAGRLVTGEEFSSADRLAEVLATARREDFLRCLTEKLMTYAVGRGVEYYDAPAIDSIVAGLGDSGGLRRLVCAVVASAPFQRVRLPQPDATSSEPLSAVDTSVNQTEGS
jgi:hypothetical protein